MSLTIKSKLGLAATVVAIVGGSLTAMNQAQVAEPHWVATRSFVREVDATRKAHIDRSLGGNALRQTTLEIAVVNGRRDSMRNSKFNLELLLQKEPNASADYRANIQRQLLEINDRVQIADDRLKELRAEKMALERDAARN